MATEVFIYGLIDPRNLGHVRYVGKANNIDKRLKSHIANNNSDLKTHKGKWIKSLLTCGIYPKAILLKISNSENWKVDEIGQIKLLKNLGHKLTNGTDGGEGFNDSSGSVAAKISKSLTGKKQSIESKEKRAKAHFGKKHKPESIEKMKLAQKGRKVSELTKERIRLAKLGTRQSEETRLKRSLALKGRVFSEEHRQKLSEAATRRYKFAGN